MSENPNNRSDAGMLTSRRESPAVTLDEALTALAEARRQIADLEYQLNSERVEAGELQRLAGQIAERDEALRLAHADLEVIYKASAHCQGRFGGRMSEVDRIFQEITRVSSLHHGRAALLSKGSEEPARIAEIAKSEACQGDDGVICEGDCACKRKARGEGLPESPSGSPPEAAVGTTAALATDAHPSEDEITQILFSVQRGAMRLRVAAVAIINLYESAKPSAWRYEFSTPRQENGYRDGSTVWHVGYGADRPTYDVRNLTALYERRITSA